MRMILIMANDKGNAEGRFHCRMWSTQNVTAGEKEPHNSLWLLEILMVAELN